MDKSRGQAPDALKQRIIPKNENKIFCLFFMYIKKTLNSEQKEINLYCAEK